MTPATLLVRAWWSSLAVIKLRWLSQTSRTNLTLLVHQSPKDLTEMEVEVSQGAEVLLVTSTSKANSMLFTGVECLCKTTRVDKYLPKEFWQRFLRINRLDNRPSTKQITQICWTQRSNRFWATKVLPPVQTWWTSSRAQWTTWESTYTLKAGPEPKMLHSNQGLVLSLETMLEATHLISRSSITITKKQLTETEGMSRITTPATTQKMFLRLLQLTEHSTTTTLQVHSRLKLTLRTTTFLYPARWGLQ